MKIGRWTYLCTLLLTIFLVAVIVAYSLGASGNDWQTAIDMGAWPLAIIVMVSAITIHMFNAINNPRSWVYKGKDFKHSLMMFLKAAGKLLFLLLIAVVIIGAIVYIMVWQREHCVLVICFWGGGVILSKVIGGALWNSGIGYLRVLSYPFNIIVNLHLYFLFPMMMLICYAGAIFFITTGLPFVILMQLRHVLAWDMDVHSICFLCIVTGTISAVHLSPCLKKVVYYILQFDMLGKEVSQRMRDFTDYVLSEKTVKFAIYLAYFAVLLITTFLHLKDGSHLFGEAMDETIIKSFLVYIAFNNMRINLKEVKFSITKAFDMFVNIVQ